MLISAKLAPVFPYPVLEEFWRASDELGFHGVWNYDHFYGLTDPGQDTLEGWTLLGAMAKVVKRARIGCMVTGVTYRHPAVLANMAVTVDHASEGRLEFGIGAAWHELEHQAYGLPFPSAGTRVEMLDEAIAVIRALWTEDEADFKGEHFTLDKARCVPKPVQRPHPPIVVGGGRPKMIKLIARHADEWNAPIGDPPTWAEANASLTRACEELGRDPTSVRRGVQLFLHPAQEGQVDEVLATMPAYEDAGCEHAVLSFYAPPGPDLLERVAPR